ncbi:MAG: hypothetical protein ACD_23C00017G0001 [uncultured bacterium]|nr:MAG: hypothetical protein ACD_23C00017G0001 [uncultured bacterium]
MIVANAFGDAKEWRAELFVAGESAVSDGPLHCFYCRQLGYEHKNTPCGPYRSALPPTRKQMEGIPSGKHQAHRITAAGMHRATPSVRGGKTAGESLQGRRLWDNPAP